MEKKNKNNNSCDTRDTWRQESGIKIVREIRGDKEHEYNSCDTRDTWRKKASIGDFYKSPRRGETFNNTVQAVRRSAVIVKM